MHSISHLQSPSVSFNHDHNLFPAKLHLLNQTYPRGGGSESTLVLTSNFFMFCWCVVQQISSNSTCVEKYYSLPACVSACLGWSCALCHIVYVHSGKDFASSTLSSVLVCAFVQVRKQTQQNQHRLSAYIFFFSSPLFDPVKHPIISLIIAILVVLSLPRAFPHPPQPLGQP